MRRSLHLLLSIRFSRLLMLAVLFLSGSILTGCADGVFTAQDETVQARRRVEAGSKFRHAHLLEGV